MPLEKSPIDVRTYRAASLQDALRLVREELGPEAAVLHTREISPGGWFGSRKIEVTASNSVNVPSRLPPELLAPRTNLARSHEPESPAIETPAADSHAARFRKNLLEHLHNEDRTPELESLAGAASPAADTMRAELLEQGVSPALARELIEAAARRLTETERRDLSALRERLVRLVAEKIEVAGPLNIAPGTQTRAALIGPTGVGKTTTIAKLAGHYRLREKLSVGLITVDTFRIAAVEQLQTYGEIMHSPVAAVRTPAEMRRVLQSFVKCDLVLIDTAGRSPNEEAPRRELQAILAAAQPQETHLALSATSSSSVLLQSTERFASLAPNRLLITKLDEVSQLGSLLPLVKQNRLPWSYSTHGQHVPSDIALVDRRTLAARMLSRE